MNYSFYASLIKNTIFVLALTNFISCGKFRYSPYSVDVKNYNLNNKNLRLIKDKESKLGQYYSVVIISDTHNYYKDLDKVVSIINSKRNKVAFVIVTGDITDFGLLSEYLVSVEFLNKLKVPFLVLIGNHDYLANGSRIFEKIFGNKKMKFSFKNRNFFLLDNNTWERGNSFLQHSWVVDNLMLSDKKNNIVLSHIAPNDSDRFSKNFIYNFGELIYHSNVQFYINGHNHNPGFGTFGGATHITVGSISKHVYLELNFSPFGVQHATIQF